MSLPKPLSLLARTLGKGPRLDLRLRALVDLLFGIGGALRELRGEAGLQKHLVEPAHAAGRAQGARYVRDFGITGRNAISSSGAAIIGLETYEAKYEVRAAKSRHLELIVRSCPLRDAARESGAAAENACCGACGGYLQGLVQAVNPAARFEMPERMGWGNDRCRAEVHVAKHEPGPTGFDLPREVEFMPTTTRRRLLIDGLSEALSQAARAGASLDRATAARIMARGAAPAGVAAGRRVRVGFGVEGTGIEAAVLSTRLVNDVQGVAPEVLRQEEDEATWRTSGCVMVDAKSLPPAAAAFACTACQHFHEGVAQEASPGLEVRVQQRILEGATACEFTARRVPVTEQLRRTQRGWVDAGVTRVALFDSASTYYYVWKLLGETLEHVGRRAAVDLARREVRERGLAKDESGFRAAVEAFVRAGYGGLTVSSVDLAEPRATIVCANSFEAESVLGHEATKEPACHMLRGLLAGLLQEMSGVHDVACAERQCVARGDPTCEFVLAPEP